jgi:hypothetical protein
MSTMPQVAAGPLSAVQVARAKRFYTSQPARYTASGAERQCDPAARQAKAEARFDRAVAEHDDLPHEFDAERLETKVRQQF